MDLHQPPIVIITELLLPHPHRMVERSIFSPPPPVTHKHTHLFPAHSLRVRQRHMMEERFIV